MHGLRASLEPHVYRDIEIASDQSLFELAQVITRAFGFDFEHAFGFFNRLAGRVFGSPVRYELFADEEDFGWKGVPSGRRPASADHARRG